MTVETAEPLFFRAHKPTFGPYLRKLREAHGMSLRDAAARLGLTFSKLQKMERGTRFRIPELAFLFRIATLYAVSTSEVFAEAGIEQRSADIVGETAVDRSFMALVLHPDLRPLGMDAHWCQSFSHLQKRQIVEFALSAEQAVLGGLSIRTIVEGARVDDAMPEPVVMAWGARPGFPAYLKVLRHSAGLTLRDAAKAIGMSHSNLARLESVEGLKVRRTTLTRISSVYNVKPAELQRAAGWLEAP